MATAHGKFLPASGIAARVQSQSGELFTFQDQSVLKVKIDRGEEQSVTLSATDFATTRWVMEGGMKLYIDATAEELAYVLDRDITGARVFTEYSETWLLDGDMEKRGVGDWNVLNSAELSKMPGGPEAGTRVLRVAYTSQANPAAYQGSLVSAYKFRLRGWARGDGVSAVPRIEGPSSQLIWEGTLSSVWQYFDEEFLLSSSGSLYLYNWGSSGWCEFDDLIVQPLKVTIASLTSGDESFVEVTQDV